MIGYIIWDALWISTPPGDPVALCWFAFAEIAVGGLGAFLGFFFVGNMMAGVASRLNGAPFAEGDRVEVLGAGPFCGRRGRVYDVWPSQDAVRVDLGAEAKESAVDVFRSFEVWRVS